MCGIAGAIDLTGEREFPAQRLFMMTGAIAHRGPDDERIHIERGVAMGVRRLSVIDLEHGRQPISNEDGTVWVAYNGELFQYPAIRKELLARGHRLATRCDTEAWVHLYEDHGEGMFDKASGQIGVALWDRKERLLILGRDRMGVAPLYYAERDGWLLWGSEIKALLASGMVAARPDPKGVDHFFSFFCAGTTRTFFEGVKSIPPGHYLRIQNGRVELKKHWELDFPDKGDERRMKDPTPLVDEFMGLLETSVERRLHSDVPVVSYLSGGLDSTVVLGMTKRVTGEAVRSFTIGLDHAGPDERSKASESARLLGSPLTTVTMNRADIAATFPELIVAAEGPVLDTSSACLLRLAREVHNQGYKVALTGEGADEALAGYVWFKVQKIRQALLGPIGQTGRRFLLKTLRSLGGKGSSKRGGATNPRAIAGVRVAQQDLFELTSQGRSLFYRPEMWDALGDHNPYDDLDITNDRFARWDPMNQSLYVAFKTLFAGMLMIAKGDRVARHSSIETRYPFLDNDIIEFCSSIAPEYKLRGFSDKWILRQVAAKMLPPQIAKRRKTMFRASMAETFIGEGHPAWVDQLLSPDSLCASGYFDADAVISRRERFANMPRYLPKRFILDVGLTSVVTTQLWHHLYCGGGLCDLPVSAPPARAFPPVDVGSASAEPMVESVHEHAREDDHPEARELGHESLGSRQAATSAAGR